MENTVLMELPQVPKFQTQWKRAPIKGQRFTMPTMTTPDMSMSLVELIDKFASGMPMAVQQKMYNDGNGHDTEIQDDLLEGRHWDSLDIVEKHEILKIAKDDYLRITESVKKDRKAKADHFEKIRKEKQKKDQEVYDFYEKNKSKKDQ